MQWNENVTCATCTKSQKLNEWLNATTLVYSWWQCSIKYNNIKMLHIIKLPTLHTIHSNNKKERKKSENYYFYGN